MFLIRKIASTCVLATLVGVLLPLLLMRFGVSQGYAAGITILAFLYVGVVLTGIGAFQNRNTTMLGERIRGYKKLARGFPFFYAGWLSLFGIVGGTDGWATLGLIGLVLMLAIVPMAFAKDYLGRWSLRCASAILPLLPFAASWWMRAHGWSVLQVCLLALVLWGLSVYLTRFRRERTIPQAVALDPASARMTRPSGPRAGRLCDLKA